jgi:hypothetical protein
MKIAGSGSVNQRYGSADPDSYQNVTDPQHCCKFLRPKTQVVQQCGGSGSAGSMCFWASEIRIH